VLLLRLHLFKPRLDCFLHTRFQHWVGSARHAWPALHLHHGLMCPTRLRRMLHAARLASQLRRRKHARRRPHHHLPTHNHQRPRLLLLLLLVLILLQLLLHLRWHHVEERHHAPRQRLQGTCLLRTSLRRHALLHR
jgi:hypothetical protein